jgi:type II secretory pathway component PulJ
MKERTKGLTLLELLISSMLVLLVTLAAYSAFYAGKNGYSAVQLRAEQDQEARVFLEKLARDLRNSFAYSPKDAGFTGSRESVEFFTLRDRYARKSLSRKFSRAGYLHRPGGLYLRYRDDGIALDGPSQEGYVLLLPGIRECSFSYASANTQEKKVDWREEWADPLTLPCAVRVTFVFNETGENFTHVIFLPR